MTKVSLSKLQARHYVLFLLALLFVLYGIYQTYLPFLAERRYRDGFFYDALGRQRLAVLELEKAVDHAPYEAHYYQELGKFIENYAAKIQDKKEKERLYFRAISLYQKIEAMDERNPWYKNRIARVYTRLYEMNEGEMRNKYIKKAKEYHKAAAMADAQNPLFQMNLAYFLHTLREYDEAIYYYQKAIDMDELLYDAQFNLAVIYQIKGQKEKALEELLSIYKKDPDHRNLRQAIASIYIERKEYNKALPLLKVAYAKNPSDLLTMKNLIASYFQLGSPVAILDVYENLFRRYPREQQTYASFYVRNLLQHNRVNDAVAFLDRYLLQFPEDENAKTLRRTILKTIKDKVTK